MKTIDRILHQSGHLVEYLVESMSGGKDALGEVTVKCDFGAGRLVTGKGASTDVIDASARAYLNAVNRFRQQSREPAKVPSQSEDFEPATV
jgi:2-isopropylmalate synthase